MQNELLHRLALCLVPGIGPVQAKILAEHFGNASSIFKAKKHYLEKIDGIGAMKAKAVISFRDFSRAEEEALFLEKYHIDPLFLTDDRYPKRLLNCYDPPLMLFYKGNADLNRSRTVALIGTRSHSDYGRQVTEKLIADLESTGVLVISGLAFGIDGIAHKAALKNKLQTVGVLAHGLDNIYPPQHHGLAKEMLSQGGLLTECFSKTKPDKHRFPTRNRIVAGLSDAVVVAESGIKGGSMITAELANGYNKDVFAFPGKTTDHKSAGCNHLIKNNKAILLTDAKQLVETMGWSEKSRTKPAVQKEMFIELSAQEKIVIGILEQKEKTAIDELHLKSQLSSSAVAAAILNLELNNIIASLPGKLYCIL